MWVVPSVKRILVWAALYACASLTPAAAQQPVTGTPAAAQQTFTGTLSDSGCGASHRAKASAGAKTDRECLFECINGLAKYVLVVEGSQVIPIANQDAMGLPLYAGRPVKLTGERRGGAIFITKVEAIPAHLHLGHVMTNWRDTPGTRGFLPVAVDEARLAVLHADLAAKAAGLEEIQLHAGHVLHVLDPTIEPKGPGAGYGVKRAATGALQHFELAAKAEGATDGITTHASDVSSSLSDVLRWTDQAIVAAKSVRAATDPGEAARLAADLSALVKRISEDGLKPAQTLMVLILKTEGLQGAPR
jgi:hypothetical protein